MTEAASRTLTEQLAQGLGFAIGVGSVALYSPLLYRLWRKRTADGLSVSVWVMKSCSYAVSAAYSHAHGYPLSTYVEALSIGAQAFALLCLVCHFQKAWAPALLVAAGGTALTAVCTMSADGGVALLTSLQVVAVVGSAAALVPQIRLNHARSSSGEFSPITAALLVGGNLLRAWTTVQLAGGDAVLMGGFALGFTVSSALLAQIVYYGVVKERMSICDVMLSDFVTKQPTR